MVTGRVIPTGPFSFYLEWDVIDTEIEQGDYFVIYRANGEEDLYDRIVSLPTSTRHYVDEGGNNLSEHRLFYFKIELIRGTEVIDASKSLSVAYTDGQRDFFYSMIQESSDMGYKSLFGVKCYVLQKKTWGERCVCTESLRNTPGTARCKICFGTGYIGGYYDPILTKVKRNPRLKRHIIQSFSMEPEDVMFKVMNYPVLKPGDILVDGNNIRYDIVNIRVNKLLDLTVSQIIQSRKIISMKDSVYLVDLDLTQLVPDNYKRWVPL